MCLCISDITLFRPRSHNISILLSTHLLKYMLYHDNVFFAIIKQISIQIIQFASLLRDFKIRLFYCSYHVCVYIYIVYNECMSIIPIN